MWGNLKIKGLGYMDPEIVQYTQNPIAKGYEMTSRTNEGYTPNFSRRACRSQGFRAADFHALDKGLLFRQGVNARNSRLAQPSETPDR